MKSAELNENLILRMAEGDGGAFKELYMQTSSAVYGFALSILRNKYDAEDVMHDAYIKIYTSAVTYIPKGKPLSWILTIVRNLCLNKIRQGSISEDISDYYPYISIDNMDDTDNKLLLEQALKILDYEERQIVILHALTGLKHREIAEILDLSLGTVLSKYNRSLKKMKKELEGRGNNNEK